MSKEIFANLITTKLKAAVGTDGSKYSSGTTGMAQSAIAEAITEYLVANTTIMISYNGVTASGSADVIASDTMKIVGACTLATAPTNFAAWVATIQSSIASAFTVQSPSTQGVVTTFQPFSSVAGALQISQSNLKSIHESNSKSPMLPVWSTICDSILNWLNSTAGLNTTAISVPATRSGVSSGTATLLSISVM